MKRDMELVRRILLALEERRPGDLTPVEPEEVDADEAALLEHLDLLEDAGLIAGIAHRAALHGGARVIGWGTMQLTWAGHDFIAAAMNDTVWNAAKKQAGDMFRSLSVGTLSALLQSVMKQHLGLP